jgi:HK97 gp10 family phage protein
MPIKTRLTTKGFAEYLERLAQAGKNIDAIAGEALLAGGEVLLEGMRRRVPVDTHNLQNHLNLQGPKRDGNFNYVEIGLMGADAETARYGNVQEYGSSSMAAQPYVRPTLDEDMKKARAKMKEVFGKHEAL